jgi:hypothetical protein
MRIRKALTHPLIKVLEAGKFAIVAKGLRRA